MNDSKNMILAVVLSALVLLGWTWAANKYFPTANPPSTKIENGKQQPLPQPQAQPTAPPRRRRCRPRRGARRRRRASASRRRRCSGSINLKGAQIDDLLLVTQRQTIAKNSPPVRLLSPLGAPGAYIAQFGWTGAGRGSARPRHDLDRRQQSADARPAGDAERPKCRRHALPDQDRGRRRLSVHGPAERHQRLGQAALRSGRSASSAAPTKSPDPRQLDQPRRPDRRVRRQGQLRRQLERPRREGGRRRSTTAAAGSALPTNIG